MKQEYKFATWLRVAATISILLCHFVVYNSHSLVKASAQFFSMGVDLFIILSGFLFGVHKEKIGVFAWYKKRLKRIFVPYEIFVIILFAVHVCCGLSVLDRNWIWLVFGLQGSSVGVLGAEQTWFITPLLMCYAITPLLEKFFCPEQRKGYVILFLIVVSFLPILYVLPRSPAFNTLLSLVSYYILAFAFGRYFHTLDITKRKAGMAILIAALAFCVRLIAHYFIDGTVLYDRLICGYTQFIAAFCIFYLFAFVFKEKNPPSVVRYISDNSFEIYLMHYMFCVGPLSFFGITPYWMVNCVFVTIVTFISATLLHKLSKQIMKNLR